MGVDNLAQIPTPYALTVKGRRAFVKTHFNIQYDNKRVNRAKELIANSTVICVFGWALGVTDRTWASALYDWLIEDSTHHLVVYQHDTNQYNRYNYDEIMSIEEERKIQICERIGFKDRSALRRIHIPIGNKIFDFSPDNLTPLGYAGPPIKIFDNIYNT